VPRRRTSIAALLAEGRLERIAADVDEADELVRQADTHLSSAQRLADEDPAGAYQLLYDAARKATTADMLAAGYRAKSDRPGAHAAVVLYAEEALANEAERESLANFDAVATGPSTALASSVARNWTRTFAHARAIVSAVQRRLKRSGGDS
jgi:hypothetical protein